MNNCYVYKYSDLSRNEIIYIGKGSGKRAWFHLRRSDMHPLVQRIQKMLRENNKPIISFICTGIDAELAGLVECEAISKLGRKDLCKGTLLNLTDGGEGLVNPSKETRAKLSAIRRGKTNSDESKDKIRQKAIGRKLSDDHKEKISIGMSKAIRQPCAEATKLKIGDANRGKSNPEGQKKAALARTGLKRSAEAIKKTSLANTGQKRSDETKAKLRALWEIRRAK